MLFQGLRRIRELTGLCLGNLNGQTCESLSKCLWDCVRTPVPRPTCQAGKAPNLQIVFGVCCGAGGVGRPF